VGVRVLVVEDVEADAELALRRMRQDGVDCSYVRVETEDDFKSALQGRNHDLILSDFSLPQFDGLTALAIATLLAPEIPFIFVSGTIGEERAIEALRCGAVDYVLKSNLKRLAPAVRRALREADERSARNVAEARLRDVIDVARDWIWELDKDGRFIFSSESVRDILGVEPQQLQGTHFADWLDDADRRRVQEEMSRLNSRNRTTGSLTARWRHAGGGVRWLERHALALVDPGGNVTGYRGADRDVTEREAQQARIRRLTRILEMLSGINTAVVRIRDRMDLMHEACRIAVTIGRYATAFISVLDPTTRTARPHAWAGERSETVRDLFFCVSQSASEDSSVTGRVLRSGEVFLCNDIAQLDEKVSNWKTMRNVSFRSFVALPLQIDGTTVGALTLTSSDTDAITDDELRLLREVAANLSFALQYFEKESAVQFLSFFDPLTGLAKRSLFCERLSRRILARKADEPQPAVAVLDIERLSILNDSYGRHAGDHLLQGIAERLKGRFNTDQLAYLGSGCFGMMLEHAGNQDDALREMQQHTHALFEQSFRIAGHDVPVTIKSGIACRGSTDADAEALLQNAEAGLRQAKAAGEQYHQYRMELSSKLAARLALEHRLRGALEHQQYTLYYQPKIDIATGRIEGVEALLRWIDPERGVISPGEFLPVLESTGMIVAVGEWALRRAADDCRRWQAHGLRPVHVAVNCSPLQLRRRGFAEQVLDVIEGWSGDGWGLDLEITESLLIEPDSSEVLKLRALRAAGVRVAIDDFGTGYSSLRRLSDLPVDTLKIDRSFISGLPNERAAARLVPTIIDMARAFDLITVAEGVETRAQFDFLARAGCAQSQGFLHARPMPAADLELLLAIPAQVVQPIQPTELPDTARPARGYRS